MLMLTDKSIWNQFSKAAQERIAAIPHSNHHVRSNALDPLPSNSFWSRDGKRDDRRQCKGFF